MLFPASFLISEVPRKTTMNGLCVRKSKWNAPKAANAKALDILNKGVDSLSFHVKAKELNAEYIETLLKDICAECVELNFSTCQGHVVELAQLLVAYFQKKDYDLTKLQAPSTMTTSTRCLPKVKKKVIWWQQPRR